MLTKFETKSNRVKGLSFHPKRPWILASLHSGVVQLWDYRMGTLIDRFDEHEGPVRGIHFHPTQPLFVSGGDDYKIKVWNYKTRRCLFTLLGHLDYIRTVQFHHESPWIVSASDDQTLRLWNWQSRTCIAVLTGHNHYVMCAQFHPRDDLVASASLDQTVRVWDVSALRKKGAAPGGAGPPSDDSMRLPPINSDLFGGSDAVVKYVLEGHDRGVNWAAFHPTLPLVVSGADDRQIKLWRMNESKAWEVDTLRGHVNNVSSVIFHAKQDLIISDSEDKSLRVWDLSKRVGVQTFRREHDRFWILAGHPSINLLAAGHDSGMIVFKLERERPAYALHAGTLYYVKDRYVRSHELASGRDVPLCALRRNPAAAYNQGARALAYNPAEHSVLVWSDVDGGGYELYALPREPAAGKDGGAGAEPRRGAAAAAVWVGRNRFATLDRGANALLVRDLAGEVTKRLASPLAATDGLFPGGAPGQVLLRGDDRVALFDVARRAVVAELAAPGVRYVAWSEDGTRVALLAKHCVTLAGGRDLADPASVHETLRVKSAAWDGSRVLVYSTLNHLKYALPGGDGGTLRTLPDPVYLVRAEGGAVHCLDREARPRALRVDTSEVEFKLALAARRYDAVLALIRRGALAGQAIIAYLQEKGYPEVALHFVRDERIRFGLAVECGNVEVALASAQALDDRDTWYRLGVEALRAGNAAIAEFAYQKTHSYDRLAFLYLVTGAADKLAKMAKIAERRGDARARLQAALYLGDAGEQARVLEAGGQPALAYLAAARAGLGAEAERLSEALDPELRRALDAARGGDLPAPPPVLLREANWPLLTVSKGFFETLATKDAGRDRERGLDGGAGVATDAAAVVADAALDMEGVGDAWGDDDQLLASGDEGAVYDDGEAAAGSGGEGGGWDLDDDLDLPSSPTGGAGAAGGAAAFAAPAPGPLPEHGWQARAALAGEHFAAGGFEAGARLLRAQLGVVELGPLRALALDAAAAAHAFVPGLAGTPALGVGLEAGWGEEGGGAAARLPAPPATLARLEEALRRAYRAVTEGKFSDALRLIDGILHAVPLVVVDSRKGVDEVRELLGIARDYNIAVRCELKRREARDDPRRAAELAAYFTHCALQRVHLALSLRSAMSAFFKLKNYATCATFARRLLDLQPDEKMATQARQVLAACEKSPTDAVQLEYDPRNPFDLCSVTWTPIYRGHKFVEDPYTKARFQPQAEGQLSPVGGLSRIGLEASGLVCSHTQLR
ncbi:COPA1 [Auxenochlorella protothecoides x Auxenochlorella symbiontica]